MITCLNWTVVTMKVFVKVCYLSNSMLFLILLDLSECKE